MRSGKVRDPKLTRKQRLFALEYLVDLNAAGAARRAGYSAKSADEIAPRLLKKPAIAAFLSEHAAEMSRELELTVKRVERELARCAFVDPRQIVDETGQMRALHEIPEDTRRAIRSVKVRELFEGKGAEREVVGQVVEVRFADKVAALHLAAKRLGLLTERHELVAPANVVVNIGVRRGRGKLTAQPAHLPEGAER